MRAITISQRAEDDLEEILAYIAHDSPAQAAIMVHRLYRASLDLAETATNYQRVPHPLYHEVRRRVVGPYNIVYSVSDDMVDVLFIAHGARNFRRLLYPFE